MRILLLLSLLLTGCWTPLPFYDSGSLAIEIAGEPSVDDDGFCLPLWFRLAADAGTNQTIQDVDMGYGWVGVEVHEHPDWLPDFQVASGLSSYHRRDNFVRPGRASGVDFWTIKKVAMIDGFLNDDGTPRANRLYFYANEQRGNVDWDAKEKGIRYVIEWWSGDHPENPIPGRARLVITVPGTDARREWSGDGP